MQLELTTHIDATPEDVWAVVADVRSWPDFLDSFETIRFTSPGDLGEGSIARVKQPVLLAATWTITSWRPGAGFDWQAKAAGTTTVGTHDLEADGNGTRLTLGVHQHGPLAPLLALLIGSRARRYVRIELAGMKSAAEQRAGHIPG